MIVVAGIPLLTLATLTIQHALNVTQLLSDLTRKAAGMERYRLSALMKDVEMGGDIDVVIAADAQRALDGERTAKKAYQSTVVDLRKQLATLQAQLVAEQQRADRAVKDRSDVLYVKTKEGLSCSEWLMRTAIAERKVKDLEAQLRQVEGDAETYRKMHAVCTMNLALANNDLTTLRQLVAALPVVDVQEVSVWLSPDESGWLVSKRPAFPAGLYWAKFRTQAEADSFRALLAYRATLAAKDAPQPAPNERVEYARLELAALFSTPGAPTLEQAKLVCENKNPADAQCILNAYEALREAAQDAGKEAQP